MQIRIVRSGWRFALAVSVMLIGFGVGVQAVSFSGGRIPGTPNINVIRLDGYLGPSVPSVREHGQSVLVLGVGGEKHLFELEHLKVLQGEVLPLGILTDIEAYHPNLILHAPKEIVDRLATASNQVEITGWYRTGTNDLIVSDVRTTR